MTWEDIIASGYRETVANPNSGDVQIWEITNKSGGWFHPVHIHLVDFKMLTRNGKPVFNYEQGPKDVAYVGENETVRLITKFTHQTGRYMIHCHNLPHEDHDMMTQFRVGVDRPDNDPVNAARAVKVGTDPTVIPVGTVPTTTTTPLAPTSTVAPTVTPGTTTTTRRATTTTTTTRRRG